ncbi:Cof-type HAD-IIB family hydrolase [Paenibacillus sp. TAB 01]|uniref:Cof-type HAD-IIB family hydrolase n=1 Tax=Paenibacillus sp. TAB 01 TaxID=3368988 RepID=UPI003752791C
MDYKIVFLDIDGTLVNENKEIPESTIHAIRQLKSKGIEPVIATGRAPYFFAHIAELLDIHSYVSLNGAYVVYKGKVVQKYPIPKEDLELLNRLAGSHGHPLVFQGEASYFANTENHPHVLDSIHSLKVELPGYNPNFWQEADICQAFLHCTEADEHRYEQAFPNLRLVRWHPYAIDVMPVGGSKARGILDLLRALELEPSQAAAFGDGLNDREMLELVGMGIAMGNAVEGLKPYADYITTSVDEDGIANGLKAIGLL